MVVKGEVLAAKQCQATEEKAVRPHAGAFAFVEKKQPHHELL